MIFIDNKYTKTYYAIVESATQNPHNGYTEKHHIVPKSLGGDNTKKNLVKLSARQHFVCHRLLTRMTSGKDKSKMVLAVWAFIRSSKNQKRNKINSRTYSVLREAWAKEISVINSGRKLPPLSPEHKKKISEATKGKKKSEATKQKMKDSWKLRDRDISESTRQKLSNASKGRTHSVETKQLMSDQRKGINPIWTQTEFTCEHCGKKGKGAVNYSRWHGDNCKKKR